MTRISEKMIAASKLKRRIGCSVTSDAYSGVKHKSRKLPALARNSRYSGKYRPACRIIQIGGTACPRPESTSRKVFVIGSDTQEKPTKTSLLKRRLAEGAAALTL